MTDSLDELQALFTRAITHPTGIADFLAQADAATQQRFAETFAESPEFDRVARMSVYADAYFWRLHDVLLDHFDLLAWLIGRDRFRNLATDYVLHRPSSDPDIRRFGARLPEFLATHDESRRWSGVAELAAIEWAMVRALDMPQPPPMTVSALAEVPIDAWPAMVLVPVASAWIGRGADDSPAADFGALWRAHERGEPPPTSIEGGAPRDVLVWRCDVDGFAVVHRTLDADEATAWRGVAAGRTFAEICAPLGDPAAAVLWLRRWIETGLLAGVVVVPPSD